MNFVVNRQGQTKKYTAYKFARSYFLVVVVFDSLLRRWIVNKLIGISNDALCLRFRLTANLVDFKNSIRHILLVLSLWEYITKAWTTPKKNWEKWSLILASSIFKNAEGCMYVNNEDYKRTKQANHWCNHPCRPVIRQCTLGMNKRRIVATKQETEESPKEHFILIE